MAGLASLGDDHNEDDPNAATVLVDGSRKTTKKAASSAWPPYGAAAGHALIPDVGVEEFAGLDDLGCPAKFWSKKAQWKPTRSSLPTSNSGYSTKDLDVSCSISKFPG